MGFKVRECEERIELDQVEGREKTRKEGCWECYSKYLEQNCFSHFHSSRCHLAMVALDDCQKAMVAS